MSFGVSKQVMIWLAIVMVVALILLIMQAVRVNPPLSSGPLPERRVYTERGPIIPGSIEVEPNGFFSQKIDLNRKARLVGSFKTSDLRARVSVLVLSDIEF